MNPATTAEPANTRLFVLALGLLVGFVIGFILLLSWLPVDSSLSHRTEERDARARQYDFYTELPRTRSDDEPVRIARAVSDRPVVQPATRVVPGNAQLVGVRQATPAIPANTNDEQPRVARQSYYLQAGNFQRPDEAERARASVLLLGLEASIVVRNDQNGLAGHRVRIGPFFDPSRLTEAKLRLRSNNIPYQIIRVTS